MLEYIFVYESGVKGPTLAITKGIFKVSTNVQRL